MEKNNKYKEQLLKIHKLCMCVHENTENIKVNALGVVIMRIVDEVINDG